MSAANAFQTTNGLPDYAAWAGIGAAAFSQPDIRANHLVNKIDYVFDNPSLAMSYIAGNTAGAYAYEWYKNHSRARRQASSSIGDEVKHLVELGMSTALGVFAGSALQLVCMNPAFANRIPGIKNTWLDPSLTANEDTRKYIGRVAPWAGGVLTGYAFDKYNRRL